MPPLQTLYPLGLAAANLAVGYLLYAVLDSGLGVVLAPVGVVVLLAVAHEKSRPARRRPGPLPRRLSRTTGDDAPPDEGR